MTDTDTMTLRLPPETVALLRSYGARFTPMAVSMTQLAVALIAKGAEAEGVGVGDDARAEVTS